MEDDALLDKYDYLLPAKFEGGYLLISLYEKIKGKELPNPFTTQDIKNILAQISSKYNQGIFQSDRIIRPLLHYILRNVPGVAGKYYLTDYAEELVELLKRKLESPYKDHPLQRSFERYFVIRQTEINDISDLERKFGREFVAPYKRIINDHIESLDDELREAIESLNTILYSKEESAGVIVNNFVVVFKKFGNRAEEIMRALITKDRFLRYLRSQVDQFYASVHNYKHPETLEDAEELHKLTAAWESACQISEDLDTYFLAVDAKIAMIRKQILYASEKLSELHENFSSRSKLRLQIKRLLNFALENAYYYEKDLRFINNFPLKSLVYEKTQFLNPGRYDFEITQNNQVVSVSIDSEYEYVQRQSIAHEIKRQEVINHWITKAKQLLEERPVQLNRLIEEILAQETDLVIAQQVAVELINYASESPRHRLSTSLTPNYINNTYMTIWKTDLMTLSTLPSSERKK